MMADLKPDIQLAHDASGVILSEAFRSLCLQIIVLRIIYVLYMIAIGPSAELQVV
jgi:hypothetical protein